MMSNDVNEDSVNIEDIAIENHYYDSVSNHFKLKKLVKNRIILITLGLFIVVAIISIILLILGLGK